MATYQDIKGLRVKYLSADPSTLAGGEVWYNSTSGTLKATVISTATWSSGGDLTSARRALWGAGTQTAGLAFGGYPTTGATEEYGGTSWTNGGGLSTGRYHLAGTGTQTAGVAFGGIIPPVTGVTEEYNGSSWTGSGSLGTSRYVIGALGIQTAAVCIGGYPSGTATENYDGSSWTGGGAYPESKQAIAGCGTSTAGLGVGGGPDTLVTAEYDGSSWTAVNNANYAVNNGFASGTQTSAVLSGGNPAPTSAITQTYDGTNWTTSAATLGVGRYAQGGSSTSGTAALSFGGATPGAVNKATTEEFTGATSVAAASTLTTS